MSGATKYWFSDVTSKGRRSVPTPGSNNHNVNGAGGKIGIRGADREGPVEQVIGGNVMGDVYDGHIWIDLKNDAFKGAN